MEKTVAGKVGRRSGDVEESTGVDLLPDSKYRVVRPLATGETSQILEVEHTGLGRLCAAKVLRPAFAKDERLAEALQQEGRLLASVRHPNIVEVIDVGSHARTGPFLVLELLAGETLEQRLAARAPLPVEEARRIIDGLLHGLGALHDSGIIHRNLHPSHVFLARGADGSETVKILGFGTAKKLQSAESQVTDIGNIEGEAEFVAPEQREADAGPVDRRTDLFTVGALLFTMVNGQPPPRVTSRERAPMLASKVEPVPMALVDAVGRALSFSRAQRFARCEDLRQALDGTAPPQRAEFEETTTLERDPLAAARTMGFVHDAPSAVPDTAVEQVENLDEDASVLAEDEETSIDRIAPISDRIEVSDSESRATSRQRALNDDSLETDQTTPPAPAPEVRPSLSALAPLPDPDLRRKSRAPWLLVPVLLGGLGFAVWHFGLWERVSGGRPVGAAVPPPAPAPAAAEVPRAEPPPAGPSAGETPSPAPSPTASPSPSPPPPPTPSPPPTATPSPSPSPAAAAAGATPAARPAAPAEKPAAPAAAPPVRKPVGKITRPVPKKRFVPRPKPKKAIARPKAAAKPIDVPPPRATGVRPD